MSQGTVSVQKNVLHRTGSGQPQWLTNPLVRRHNSFAIQPAGRRPDQLGEGRHRQLCSTPRSNTPLRRQTRRFFGGRQPLCGNGVTSSMDLIDNPAACSPVIALSRPEPGPLTRTSNSFTPNFEAFSAQVSAARCAAKGVLLRLPLKPDVPAVAQHKTSPFTSVMVTVVLLNVALIWATAFATLRRIFLRTALLTPALPLNSCDRLPRTSHHNVSGQLPDSAHTPTQLTPLGNSHPWATHTPGATHIPMSQTPTGRCCNQRAPVCRSCGISPGQISINATP